MFDPKRCDASPEARQGQITLTKADIHIIQWAVERSHVVPFSSFMSKDLQKLMIRTYASVMGHSAHQCVNDL